jgi:hypothetical protein
MKTQYGFAHAMNGFFEIPTENARRILPAHLEPVELHHGTSIFAMTAFDFTNSEVGPYGEVVMAIVVAPMVKSGEPMPAAAMYPYRVATTTQAAREHAIERWHLPHWMEDIDLRFSSNNGSITARVAVGKTPVAELTITEHAWARNTQIYQSFMNDDSGSYLAKMVFDGPVSEHEEERGKLILREHAFNHELSIEDIYDVPFREKWMRDGVQTFDPLITINPA